MMVLIITNIWVFTGIVLVLSYVGIRSLLNSPRGRAQLQETRSKAILKGRDGYDTLEEFMSKSFRDVIITYTVVAMILSLCILAFNFFM